MNIGRGLAVLLSAGLLSGCAASVEPRGSKASHRPEGTGAATHGGGSTSGTAGSPSQPSEARARRVVLAEQAGGLALVKGPGGVSDLPIDPGEMRQGMNLVVGRYLAAGAPAANGVLVVAVDGVPEDTSQRREHLWRGMLEHIGWTEGASAQVADPGALGGSVECILASLAEDGNVVCGWADATTSGVALFPNSDLPTAARTFVAMRADLEL